MEQAGNDLDLLCGTAAIAVAVFGTDTPENRRKINYQLSIGALPGQKTNGRWWSSRRALRKHFAAALGEVAA
jgi:hypothetical protein